MDVERWPEWTASVSRIEVLDSHPFGLGSRVRIHQPRLRPAIWVVTSWEPECRFVWRTGGSGIAVVGGHFLEAVGGGCSVTLDLRFEGWFGGLIGLLNGRLAKRYVRFEAEGLKLRSEKLG